MAYTVINFQTKKALKEAIKIGEPVRVYAPGMGSVPTNGSICVEGPHYPQTHRWYAEVVIENGIVTKVK